MKFLLLTQITFQSLFPLDTPHEQRLQHLQSYFDPPLGSVITAARAELREKTERPLEVRAYVRITPPPKACFILRRSPTLPDQNICQSTEVSFTIGEIAEDGSIEWLILQSPEDEGTTVSWQTPYRIARFIALGEFDSGVHTKIPITSCVAEQSSLQRKVSLQLMNGQRWIVLFPKKDVPLEPDKKIPNLFVRTMTTGSDGKSHAMEASSGGEVEGTVEQISRADSPGSDRHSLLALRLSGRYKNVKDEVYSFNIDARNSFQMDSAHFLLTNAPMGMNGLCRYRYQGAPADPTSGVIECFKTESYDAVYLHMTCSGQIKPQLE